MLGLLADLYFGGIMPLREDDQRRKLELLREGLVGSKHSADYVAQVGNANTTKINFQNGKCALVYYTRRAVKTTVHAKRSLSLVQISKNTVSQNDFIVIICDTEEFGVLYYVVPVSILVPILHEKRTARLYIPVTDKPVYNNRKSFINWPVHRDAWGMIFA